MESEWIYSHSCSGNTRGFMQKGDMVWVTLLEENRQKEEWSPVVTSLPSSWPGSGNGLGWWRGRDRQVDGFQV